MADMSVTLPFIHTHTEETLEQASAQEPARKSAEPAPGTEACLLLPGKGSARKTENYVDRSHVLAATQ